jgi:hypothetical protein
MFVTPSQRTSLFVRKGGVYKDVRLWKTKHRLELRGMHVIWTTTFSVRLFDCLTHFISDMSDLLAFKLSMRRMNAHSFFLLFDWVIILTLSRCRSDHCLFLVIQHQSIRMVDNAVHASTDHMRPFQSKPLHSLNRASLHGRVIT